MNNLLSDYGIINNKRDIINTLGYRVPCLRCCSFNAIAKYLEESVKKKGSVYFYDWNFKSVKKKDADIMWVDTGYETASGDILYLQFIRRKDKYDEFVGAYLNTASSLEDITRRKLKEGKLIKEDRDKSIVLEKIWSRLLMPETWTTEHLDCYITSCLVRLNYCLDKKNFDCSSFVLFNENFTEAVINTGLLDKFGKSINLLVAVSGSKKILDCFDIISSKVELVNKGFDLKKFGNLKRIQFYNEDCSEYIFNASLEEIDTENWGRLIHCIHDRRDRLPEELYDCSDEMICSDMIKAVEIGVAINQCNYSYIKPFYSRKDDTINFFIPYHVNNNLQKKPDLGLVLANVDGIWQVVTILDYDAVVSNTRLFNIYTDISF